MESKKNTNKMENAIRVLSLAETCHEYFDVLDYYTDTILSWYGIIDSWTGEEYRILRSILIEKAFEEEIEEICRIAEFENDPILASIPDRGVPSEKLLELEHKIWKKEMENKKKTVENPKDSQLSIEVRK